MKLESLPHRELVEEFAETLDVSLLPTQYTFRPTGFVIENQPVPTDNANVQRRPTVRLYRTFEVEIVDISLCQTMLSANQLYSDEELGRVAFGGFTKWWTRTCKLHFNLAAEPGPGIVSGAPARRPPSEDHD